MTQEQIALVQRSFQTVQPILEGAAALFYERLFTIDPSLRALFRGSPDEQARKLAQALTVVVTSLDDVSLEAHSEGRLERSRR